MTEISALYQHLNTLTKQWFYDKSEIDSMFVEKLSEVDIPDSANLIRKSATQGLIKNDGTIDTTQYLEDERRTGEDYLIINNNQTGLVKVTNGAVSYDTNTYLTQHQDISGKANINDLSTVATTGSYTDLNNIPATFAPGEHTHSIDDITDFSASASDVTDTSAYTNIGTSANATQHAINTAIDTKIGSLLATELVVLEVTLPTASASTMNKIYLIPEADSETNDAYEVYITVEHNNSYAWEKLDTARIDLTGYATVDHVHGNITNDGKIGSTANQFVYTTTAGLVTSKNSIGNITIDGAIGSTSGQVVTTTTNGVLTTSDWVTEVDNLILQLTSYGDTLHYNGETVTINLQIMENMSGLTNGLGLFLFDTETTYTDLNDMKANVSYATFLPLEPNENTISASNGYEVQLVLHNVMPGQYYMVLCDYDENDLPNQTRNEIGYYGDTLEENEYGYNEIVNAQYGSYTPYSSGSCAEIEVVANGTNVWYAQTNY